MKKQKKERKLDYEKPQMKNLNDKRLSDEELENQNITGGDEDSIRCRGDHRYTNC